MFSCVLCNWKPWEDVLQLMALLERGLKGRGDGQPSLELTPAHGAIWIQSSTTQLKCPWDPKVATTHRKARVSNRHRKIYVSEVERSAIILNLNISRIRECLEPWELVQASPYFAIVFFFLWLVDDKTKQIWWTLSIPYTSSVFSQVVMG